MKLFFATITLFFISSISYGQQCACPHDYHLYGNNSKASIVYQFKNQIKLGLCGDANSDGTFSEYALFICGADTEINLGDGTTTCKIVFQDDTLQIRNYYSLPIGKGLTFKYIPFLITNYYTANNSLFEESYFRNHLYKYSTKEIETVLEKYKDLKQGQDNYDEKMKVASMLLWAYISGNKAAETDLIDFNKKIGPFDGAIAEEWDDIWATYGYYKEIRNKRFVRKLF